MDLKPYRKDVSAKPLTLYLCSLTNCNQITRFLLWSFFLKFLQANLTRARHKLSNSKLPIHASNEET